MTITYSKVPTFIRITNSRYYTPLPCLYSAANIK